MDSEATEFGGDPRREPEPATTARIDRYRLLEELGRGGMGVVFRAERSDGSYHQQVALKLLPGGRFAGADARQRFLAERQILARLDHPAIARLLDGGTTAAGEPYLVMELVEGLPIDRYCQERDLDVAARLRLVLEVCAAVETAHRSLVVHRDLKPSNILVTAEGRPKLLDFGIAKLLDPAASGDALVETRFGVALLTARYAAPEQFRGEPVTVATDVYALGVVLYELLSGQSPYPPEATDPVSLLQAVCERQPPAPSTAGPRLRGALAADLDAIVLKALRKEPGGRYGSVAELAADLERLLAGRPVAARRGTRRYRFGKFVRRHRWAVATGAAVGLLVLGFAADRQVQLARTAAERDKARGATEFLVDLFEASDPSTARGASVTVREALDRGAARIERELAGQPATQATLLTAVGRVYLRLGMVASARPLLDRAVELGRGSTEDRELALTLLRRGEAAQTSGDVAQAKRDYIEAERLLRSTDAPAREVALALTAAGRLEQEGGDFAAARRILAEALTVLRADPHAPPGDLAETLSVLALTEQLRGAVAVAEPLLAEAEGAARRAGERDPVQAGLLLNDVAMAHHIAGRSSRALTLLGEARAVLVAALAGDHAELANVHNSLGVVEAELGRLADAEGDFRIAYAMWVRLVGRDHSRSALAQGNLAAVQLKRGAFVEAESALRQVLQLDRVLLPSGHPDLAIDQRNLADALRELGRLEEAEALYLGAAELQRRALGEASEPFAMSELQLARLRRAQGNAAGAEAAARSALGRLEQLWPEGHPRVAVARAFVGRLLLERGELAAAEGELARALEFQRAHLPEASPERAETASLLAASLLARGELAGARELLAPALAAQEAALAANHPALLETRRRLAQARVEPPTSQASAR